MKYNFLIVEDDDLARINLEMFLREKGDISHAPNSEVALKLIKENSYDMVFLDLDLERDLAGLDLVRPVVMAGSYPVVLSGREDDATIECAYNEGCFDFLSKPFTRASFDIVLKKFDLIRSSKYIETFFKNEFVTSDCDLIEQLSVLKEVIVSDRPIYLRGATGTGKSYIAKLIHKLIFGESDKFVHLSCSEIPENLLESELFGHEKGAFTGAISKKIGKLELAHEGTLFLDEVATMPKSIQKKLLRVIEEKSFTPLGSSTQVTSNFRLISATCDDLEMMVREGDFREDLFYRLEGFNIVLKDLHKRRGDIPILIRHFMDKRSRRVVMTPETMTILKNYTWPGNVRELEKLVDLMVAKTSGVITPSELPSKFSSSMDLAVNNIEKEVITYIEENGLKAYTERIENQIVSEFIALKHGRIREAFSALKISSSSFYRIKERIESEGE
ncbi:MAG: sigma-54-dependent Fis family transcriptional regulator [Bacteriovoracaceae bacterium]|nr:sigma-54-dependent Fis family transcriptional regulator [Bacteriovoracaceae bacterium]